MNQLETLLNTLIARGGKPFNLNGVTKCEIADHGIYFYEGECSVEFCSYRELVSLESGLWQFCEKNGLLHEYTNGRSNIHPYKCYWTTTYEYRLLESALTPEEKLGKFLVDNIIVEGLKSEQYKR